MATEPIERPPFWSRETRLLLLTVALSVAVLFALARFRFPGQEPLELPAQPLQRLAARAAFEDLSAAVSRAAERLRPALQVVRVPTSVGAARTLVTRRGLVRSGAEMLVVGSAAGAVAYAIGAVVAMVV